MILLNKGIYGNVYGIVLYPKMGWGVILNSGLSKHLRVFNHSMYS